MTEDYTFVLQYDEELNIIVRDDNVIEMSGGNSLAKIFINKSEAREIANCLNKLADVIDRRKGDKK